MNFSEAKLQLNLLTTDQEVEGSNPSGYAISIRELHESNLLVETPRLTSRCILTSTSLEVRRHEKGFSSTRYGLLLSGLSVLFAKKCHVISFDKINFMRIVYRF